MKIRSINTPSLPWFYLIDFKLKTDEYIEKYKNLPVMNYRCFKIVLDDLEVGLPEKRLEILEHLLHRWNIIDQITISYIKTSTDFMRVLKAISKAKI